MINLGVEMFFWISLAAMITGVSKFSTGGMGMITLPILMIAVAGKEALGVIIVMYVITDVMAVLTYRKNINKQIIAQVMPAALVGILLGIFVLKGIDNKTFVLVLFGLTVVMLIVSLVLDKYPIDVSRYPIIAYTIGLLSGAISMIGNAGGSIFSIYMLAVGNTSKESYIGTRAWVLLLMSACKAVGLISIGLLNWQTLELGLYTLPGLLLGSLLGYTLLKKININILKNLIRILIAIAACRLLYVYLQQV